jgi:hypothetical protein
VVHQVLVFHDCTGNYVMKGDAALFDRLPPHKMLFACPPGKGLPIGNLNSQFFANVYLLRVRKLSTVTARDGFSCLFVHVA